MSENKLEFTFSRLETAQRFAEATLVDMVVLQKPDGMYAVCTKRTAVKLKNKGYKVVHEVSAS